MSTHLSFLKRKASLRILDLRAAMPNYASYRNETNRGEILGIVIHHSATIDTTTGRPSGNASRLFSYHVHTLKWDHGGYHYVIAANGRIEYALDEGIPAYHAGIQAASAGQELEGGQYWNNHYIAVCLLGWFDTGRTYRDVFGITRKVPDFHVTPSRAQLRSLVLLVQHLRRKYEFPVENVLGHRECSGQDTVCPGSLVDLSQLRKGIQQADKLGPIRCKIHPGRASTELEPVLSPQATTTLGILKKIVNTAVRGGAFLGVLALLPVQAVVWRSDLNLGILVVRLILALISLFVLVILGLRWIDPKTSAFMLANRRLLRRVGKTAAIHHRWVDLEEVSPQMRLAAIAAEDPKFLDHAGFHWYGMYIAWKGNRSGRPLRGHSTISQQLVKNLFLWPDRTYFRKIMESFITLIVEVLWPKERILEVYLNIIQLGDRIFGVEAAARHFFNKPAGGLNGAEAASLAASLPNPLYYQVSEPSAWLLKRRAEIQQAMESIAEENVRLTAGGSRNKKGDTLPG